MKRHLVALVSAVALISACDMDTSQPPTPSPTPGEAGTTTGLALTIDLERAAGVDSIQFHVETCDGTAVTTEDVALSELELAALEDLGITTEGALRFADYFVVLEPGCYDVEIQPLDDDGEAMDQCAAAVAQGIEVESGRTTEIVMVSQCGGDLFGGLDVLGVLNFAPAITNLTFDPSKIVGCDAVQVCATAVDSDGDGVEFEWAQLSGPVPAEGLAVVSSTTDADGVATECGELTPGFTGAYTFEVTAYDLMEDEDGVVRRVEDIVGDVDSAFTSRSSLSFPIYAVCVEPEDVLGEVEDREEDKKYKEDEPEDVLGEVEEEEKKHKEDEDVLGEIEEPEEEEKEKKYKEDEPEEVLGEVEEEEEEEKEKKYKEEEELEEVLGEIEGADCTYPVSYWSHHSAQWSADPYQMISEWTWMAVVQGEVEAKHAWKYLAANYVVAQLNMEAGASAPDGVMMVMWEAEELLEKEYLTVSERVRVADLTAVLYAYNLGLVGPGSCEWEY